MKFLKSLFGLRRGFLFDLRLLALLIPALIVLAADLPVLITLLYSSAAIFVVLAIGHVARRVLFPYLDLETVAAQAALGSVGAGLIFVGVSLIISATVLASVLWIGR